MANEKLGIALGMIETRGLVPAIEAVDAMTKASEVRLIGRQFVSPGGHFIMYHPRPLQSVPARAE